MIVSGMIRPESLSGQSMPLVPMRLFREGARFFDNLGGSYYNGPIFTNELGFAKPYTQFFHYRPYRSRQIYPR